MNAQKLTYGRHPDQHGWLHLPETSPSTRRPLITLIHGGFWRQVWTAALMEPLAHAFTLRGYAVWNLEYRRVGGGGGYPLTEEDLLAGMTLQALHALPSIPKTTVLVGHSAGGYCALRLGAALRKRHDSMHVAGIVSLAGVLDTNEALACGIGNGAVREYFEALQELPHPLPSPIQDLPLGIPRLLASGVDDDTVPMEQSERYCAAAASIGETCDVLFKPHVSHYDVIDPAHPVFHDICSWIADHS